MLESPSLRPNTLITTRGSENQTRHSATERSERAAEADRDKKRSVRKKPKPFQGNGRPKTQARRPEPAATPVSENGRGISLESARVRSLPYAIKGGSGRDVGRSQRRHHGLHIG